MTTRIYDKSQGCYTYKGCTTFWFKNKPDTRQYVRLDGYTVRLITLAGCGAIPTREWYHPTKKGALMHFKRFVDLCEMI